MGGDSGMGNVLDDYDVDNNGLQQMQTHFKNQATNQLNDEMVRSSAYFGFGQRPEPTAITTDDPIKKPFDPFADFNFFNK